MALEQEVNINRKCVLGPSGLRDYIGRHYQKRPEVNGCLIAVMPGVPPYTNGASRLYVFKTPEAITLWQSRHRQAISQINWDNQQMTGKETQ